MPPRVPIITPRSFISGDDDPRTRQIEDREDLYRKMNQQLPRVTGLASGGYADVKTPNPNSGMALQGLLQGYSPNRSQLTDRADAVDSALLSSYEKEKDEEVSSGRLSTADAMMHKAANRTSLVQGRQSQWRPFMQALYDVGADELQTGAAAGMERGPSSYDMTTGMTSVANKPGFFDTQVGQQTHAYDPRTARVRGANDQVNTNSTEEPFYSPYMQQRDQMKRSQVLGGLKSGMYDPHKPFRRRGY